MRSFISSSNPNSLRNTVIVFVFTFVVCTFAGLLFHHYFPTESWAGNLPATDKNDSYVVMESNSDQAYDLYGIYYGIGDLRNMAQKADVLLLGNSKPFFAFRSESVRAFVDKTRLNVFNLSVPYGDSYGMAKILIDRLHLSPSIIVIDENHFFNSRLSPFSDETVKIGYWQALVRILEHKVSWFLRSELHPIFPRLSLGKIYGSVPKVLYRSTQTGCLATGNNDENPIPVIVHPAREEVLSPEELKTALQFKKEMEGRGIRIILTSVPYGTNREPYEKVDVTARLLGLPLMVIKPNGMETFDGRHLDEKSGLKFANLFFSQFVNRPEIKVLLKRIKQR